MVNMFETEPCRIDLLVAFTSQLSATPPLYREATIHKQFCDELLLIVCTDDDDRYEGQHDDVPAFFLRAVQSGLMLYCNDGCFDQPSNRRSALGF